MKNQIHNFLLLIKTLEDPTQRIVSLKSLLTPDIASSSRSIFDFPLFICYPNSFNETQTKLKSKLRKSNDNNGSLNKSLTKLIERETGNYSSEHDRNFKRINK